jgi:hypothetical protein
VKTLRLWARDESSFAPFSPSPSPGCWTGRGYGRGRPNDRGIATHLIATVPRGTMEGG